MTIAIQLRFTPLGGGPTNLRRARIRARVVCRNMFGTRSRKVTTMLVNVGLKARRGSRYRLVAAGEVGRHTNFSYVVAARLRRSRCATSWSWFSQRLVAVGEVPVRQTVGDFCQCRGYQGRRRLLGACTINLKMNRDDHWHVVTVWQIRQRQQVTGHRSPGYQSVQISTCFSRTPRVAWQGARSVHQHLDARNVL